MAVVYARGFQDGAWLATCALFSGAENQRWSAKHVHNSRRGRDPSQKATDEGEPVRHRIALPRPKAEPMLGSRCCALRGRHTG
jgi:hypothetical protein